MTIGLGIATLGAGLLSAGANIFGAQTSAQNAKEMTAAQINWERERAMHAHQWEVQDLEKAGLNPVLSAGGQGAMTGSISPIMPDVSGYGNAGNNIMSAVMNMYQSDILRAKADNIDASTKNIEEDTTNKKEDTALKGSQIKLNKKQLSVLDANIKKINSDIQRNSVLNSRDKAEIAKIGHQITKIDSEVDLNKYEMELKSAKKDLTRDLQLLTIIKSKMGTEQYKGLQYENKIKSVQSKLRYVNAYLDTMGKIEDNALKIIPDL